MKCPSCGGRNPDDAVRCAHCGEQLNTDAPAMRENIRPRDENFNIRPVFSDVQETKAMTAWDGRQRVWVILVLIASGIALAVLAVFIFLDFRENQKTIVTTADYTVSQEIGGQVTGSEATSEVPSGITIEEKTKNEATSFGETEVTEGAEENTSESESEGSSSAEETEPVTGEITVPESTDVSEAAEEESSESTEETTESSEESTDTQSETMPGDVIQEYGGMLFLLKNGTASLYKSYSADPVIELSTIILDYPFTSIGENAFSGDAYAYKINLPVSISSIGARAFYGCEHLQEVYIPESVTWIDETAFENCPGVIIIAAPDSYAWQYAQAHGITVQAGGHTTG